jgi:ribose transport system substrate-binding protein
LAPIGESAKRKGIPLIVFDRKLNVPADQVAAFVGGDNVEMGRVAGRYIAEKLGGKGKVIQLEGTPGASATVDRKAGFEEVVAKYPDIKVVSYVGHYRRHEAVAAMEDAVVAHSDVNAVYAHNDSMALGGSQVLRERGKKDIIVIGMDGGKEGCDGVSSGEITGSVYYPTMFPEALETAVKILRGEPVPKVTMLETPLITKDNVSELCK